MEQYPLRWFKREHLQDGSVYRAVGRSWDTCLLMEVVAPRQQQPLKAVNAWDAVVQGMCPESSDNCHHKE